MSRRFLAPEVLQISAMDCGVAALTSMLSGYGIHASYEELRRRCQTGTDGTSVDALEDIGNEMGMDLYQCLVPDDAMSGVLQGRFPSIAITANPGGPPHFVVVWRIVGGWVHVMDPSRGRYWTRLSNLRAHLHRHRQRFDREEWEEWYAGSAFRDAELARCRALLSKAKAKEASVAISGEAGLEELAAADAALRLVDALKQQGTDRGSAWNDRVFDRALQAQRENPTALPRSVRAISVDEEGAQLDCVVLLTPFDVPSTRSAKEPSNVAGKDATVATAQPHVESTWREIYGLLGPDARGLAAVSFLGVAGAAVASALEIVAYRAANDIPSTFSTVTSRLAVGVNIVGLLILLTLFEGTLLWSAQAIGRYLEVRLRALTFLLLARVDDTFVRSRPTSDLAYRAHGLTLGSALPGLVLNTVRAVMNLAITAAALVWIDRVFAWVLLPAFLVFWGLSVFAGSRLREIDQKYQSHGARLLDLFLDALRGFRPLRLHGYQAAFRREHGGELRKWARTGELQARTQSTLAALDAAVGTALVGGILYMYLLRTTDIRAFVLVAFWVLRLPMLMSTVLSNANSYPATKGAFTRMLEIAKYAPAAPPVAPDADEAATSRGGAKGVALELRDVSVVLNSSHLLREVNLQIPAGQHVAVVGYSGSGKSTLASLFLGFNEANEGVVLADGRPLDPESRASLRASTAWVDPAVQLMNKPFIENLEYAAEGYGRRELLETLDSSDLLPVLESLEHGLETSVGADGRLISGGEGQRLRLGRALLRAEARLVVLDEPFRGLERAIRKRLAFRARLAWKRATMLFISHDIGHALDFERVLVVDGGRIVEDGHPLELASEEGSQFRRLLDAEKTMLEEVWGARAWRRLRVADGRVRDAGHHT